MITEESAKMYTEPWKLKVWSSDDNLQSCRTKKDNVVYVKTSFQYWVLHRTLNAHSCSVLPSASLRSPLIMVPVIIHMFTFGLLPPLCSSDSWCWRVQSERKREAGSRKKTNKQKQTHTCIITNSSLELHRYGPINEKDTHKKQQQHNNTSSSSEYCHGKQGKTKEMNLVLKTDCGFRGQTQVH